MFCCYIAQNMIEFDLIFFMQENAAPPLFSESGKFREHFKSKNRFQAENKNGQIVPANKLQGAVCFSNSQLEFI